MCLRRLSLSSVKNVDMSEDLSGNINRTDRIVLRVRLVVNSSTNFRHGIDTNDTLDREVG